MPPHAEATTPAAACRFAVDADLGDMGAVTHLPFYDALMSTWYVYEDFVTPEAVLHRGECPHCNHGLGHGRGPNQDENTWHGPFKSETDAHSVEIRSPSRIRDCRVCMV
jgi:hypothetical protein